MLAAHDQENLVHARQTAAAGKPLNQGNRQLHPKTPGPRAPKTPFKVPLNDENNPSAFNGGKIGGLKGAGRGNENVNLTARGGKQEKNAFVTPLGPQTRAPLGMKTTNAKTHAFQTPGVPATSKLIQKTNKKPSASQRKPRVTIAPTEPVLTDVLSQEESDSDVPEPEYAPPTPEPLPDPPFEFGYDETFPQFQGANLTRGYLAFYGSPVDEHGVSLRLREEQKRHQEERDEVDRQLAEMYEAEKKQDLESVTTESDRLDKEVDDMIRKADERRRKEQLPSQRKIGPSTIKARSAVSALSSTKSTMPKPIVKPANAVARPKPKFSVLSTNMKPRVTSTVAAPPTSKRTVPLETTSRNTLGYSKGRNVSSNIRAPISTKGLASTKEPKPIDQSQISPWTFKELYGNPPMGSTMWYRMQHVGLFDEPVEGGEEDAADEDELFDFGNMMADLGEEDGEVFQLPMPEMGVEG